MTELNKILQAQTAETARIAQTAASERDRIEADRQRQQQQALEQDTLNQQRAQEIARKMEKGPLGRLISPAAEIIGGKVETYYEQTHNGIVVTKAISREETEQGWGDGTGPSYNTRSTGIVVSQHEDGTVEVRGAKTITLQGNRSSDEQALDSALAKAVQRPIETSGRISRAPAATREQSTTRSTRNDGPSETPWYPRRPRGGW